MIKSLIGIAVLAALMVGCSGGTMLTKIVKRDGTVVIGEVVEARPDGVVIRDGRGNVITVPRPDIASMASISSAEAAALASNETGGPGGPNLIPSGRPADGQGSGSPARERTGNGPGGTSGDGGTRSSGDPGRTAPSGQTDRGGDGSSASGPDGAEGSERKGGDLPPGRYREVAIPAGTVLTLALDSPVASDRSRVEDAVHARLKKGVTVGETEVIPAGAPLSGVITEVRSSGKVKGQARLSFRFHTLKVGGGQALDVKTSVVSEQAKDATKADAKKVGIGAATGAIVGGIVGRSKKALGLGAAAGGAAGTAAVLATSGGEVRLAQGATVSTKLLESIVVRVPIGQ